MNIGIDAGGVRQGENRDCNVYFKGNRAAKQNR